MNEGGRRKAEGGSSTARDLNSPGHARGYFLVCAALVFSSGALPRAASMAAEPPITAIAFAPGGEQVAVGSQAGIELRSWPDLKPLRKLPTKLEAVHDLAFSPRGDVLAAAGGSPAEAGQRELWHWPAGTAHSIHRLHEDVIHQAVWRSDGAALITASADTTVAVVTTAGEVLAQCSGHSKPVLAAAFLPGEKLVVSAGVDQTIRVWDAATGRVQRVLDNHTGTVYSLAVRPGSWDGPVTIASASADRTVRIWQPTIGRLVRFVRLPKEPLAVAWSTDGKLILASCADGNLRQIDPAEARVTADISAIDGWAYSLAASPDGKAVLVGGSGGQLKRLSLDRRAQ